MLVMDKMQGSYILMNLVTKSIILHCNTTAVPITPSMIATVEQMAADNDIKGLHLRFKPNYTLYDSSWIAGVDFDDNKDEENFHS